MTFEPSALQNVFDGVRLWLSQIKLTRIIVLVFIILIIVPLFTHYYLSKVESNSLSNVQRTQTKLEAFDDLNNLKASDLKLRIEEMLRIKVSVSSELRELEAKRQRLQYDVASLTQNIEEVKQLLLHHQTELDRLKISVEQAKVAQLEALQRNTPDLAPPLELRASTIPRFFPPPSEHIFQRCQLHTCFDHSRCPLSSGFPVFLYDPEKYPLLGAGWELEGFVKTTLKQTFGYNPHVTRDPTEACLYVVLVGEALSSADSPPPVITSSRLAALPYWAGDGRNHILLNLARSSSTGSPYEHRSSTGARNPFVGVNTGRAMIIQSTFSSRDLRNKFDVVVPPLLGPPGGDVWTECAPLTPARRQYLLSFEGIFQTSTNSGRDVISKAGSFENFIVYHLIKLTQDETSDRFLLNLDCSVGPHGRSFISQWKNKRLSKGATEMDNDSIPVESGEWALCGTESSRTSVLRESTFSLIIAPSDDDLVSTTTIQTRIYESLRSGAIPIILGDHLQLPFAETIDWRRVAILLPKARVTELHLIARAVGDADLLSFRRQGRLVWERYLASVQSTVDTIIALIRFRLGIPPRPVLEETSPSVFNETFQPLKTDAIVPDAEPEESLGPMEPPYPSPKFRRNYTLFLTQGHEMWNDWGDPFHLYPQLPFDLTLPSDAKFMGSGMGFRPIGQGAGGAGKEFCESLGGNHPREQFTVVILTYEREQVLMNSLARLDGLPYLNKVVVVWNSPRPPLPDLRWPDIGVPVHVVKSNRNSLNNRFLPYDVIETEAVLSVDDDAHLRHDEIMFGFRVWREQRDRVVGFPGRFHAWDLNHGGWLYNSNYSCELSMVLTGAAFFHKYYTYLYTYWLPQAIRDKVDEYMNCEDIAMNFLVSHITKKPPVKVTSRWTFRCPGCPVSLSEDDTHFQERHKCINFFSQVFGYTPLLNTQFRADSILFKTRIPHDKQKCFKFI